MKVKLLLPLLLVAMSLAGCNGAGKGGKSESEQSEETTESGQSEESTEELNPYSDFAQFDGESAEFPMEEVNDFLEYFKMDVTLPTPDGSNWQYQQDEYNGYANFYAFCADAGTPGTDAIEDSYKAALEAAGFVVNDEDYDYSGYIVTLEEYADFQLIFYSYDGDFVFDLYGPFVALKTVGFPVERVLEYFLTYGYELDASDLYIPESTAVWSSYVYVSFFGESLIVETEGTAEDVNAFVENVPEEWTVDDYSETPEEPYFDIYKEIAENVELDVTVYLENGLFTLAFGIYDYNEAE